MREKIQDHRCKDKRRTSGNNGALFSGGVQVIVVAAVIPASSTRVHQPQIQNNMKAAPPSGSVMYWRLDIEAMTDVNVFIFMLNLKHFANTLFYSHFKQKRDCVKKTHTDVQD